MSRALPDDWPTIWIEASCSSCGQDLFAELFRPAVLERFLPEQAAPGGMSLATFWRRVLVDHLRRAHGVDVEPGPNDPRVPLGPKVPR